MIKDRNGGHVQKIAPEYLREGEYAQKKALK